ncbi:MAG: cytochrome-c oxidase [Betaproteobacteria bacterium HGW-Betaproteobacteria-12]|nr:MAG: cytochrome-c oxidase [Betaproteobacteria bacterium HGW-Betaproteobacteria-12]
MATVSLTVPVAASRHLPGDRDVWIFIMAELMTFSAFFIAYMFYRNGDVELFNRGQATLDRNLGVLNTLLLILSSWGVVRAIAAARTNRRRQIVSYLGVAIGLALAFMVVKYFEYAAKFAVGITLTSNDFYMFYFCLTMIHLAHVVGGTVILSVLLRNARAGKYHAGNLRGLETGASFWHMVDLLWIFLFPLFYLLR